jgi:hypothetical protein
MSEMLYTGCGLTGETKIMISDDTVATLISKHTRATDDSKLLFIHVPKTGGSSINHSLFDLFIKGPDVKVAHMKANTRTLREAIVEIPKEVELSKQRGVELASLADRLIFSTVRNPYERFYSFYVTHVLKPCRVKEGSGRWMECFEEKEGIGPGFSLKGFERFIVEDYQAYIKTETSSRSDKKCIRTACSDKPFVDWVTSDKLADRKICENVYKLYFSTGENCSHKIRYILFENIQEEYRKMLDYLISTGVVDRGFNSLTDYESEIRAQALGCVRDPRSKRRLNSFISSGLNLVNISPRRSGKGRNPSLVFRGSDKELGVLKFYTDKAKSVFDRFNQEDIEFYAQLKKLSFEQRFAEGLSYNDLVYNSQE